MREKEDFDDNKHFQLSEDEIIDTNTLDSHIDLNINIKNKEDEKPELKKNSDIYTVFLGSNKNLNSHLFETNKISTAKYNWYNVFPKILMEQFSRICNVYILIIAMLQTFKSISYSDGNPLILLPFTSILLLNGFKDYMEDQKRVKSDNDENNTETLIYDKNSKTFIKDKWENIN